MCSALHPTQARRAASRPAPALGRALSAPFVASILWPRLSPGKRRSQGRCRREGGGSTAPASRFTSPSPRPHAPCRDLPRKGGGGSRRGLRRSGSACLDPGIFWPHPQTGEVFPSPLTLFKFKATAAAPSPRPHPAGGPAELRPGVPLEQLRSHPGVGFPTPGALSCVPPRADGGAPCGAHQVVSPCCWCGGGIPANFAGSLAGIEADRVPRRRLSLLKSDLGSQGGAGAHSGYTDFPRTLLSPPSAGKSGAAGVSLRE